MQEQYLTVGEFSELFKVSAKTTYRKALQGVIPSTRIFGRIRIPISYLDQIDPHLVINFAKEKSMYMQFKSWSEFNTFIHDQIKKNIFFRLNLRILGFKETISINWFRKNKEVLEVQISSNILAITQTPITTPARFIEIGWNAPSEGSGCYWKVFNVSDSDPVNVAFAIREVLDKVLSADLQHILFNSETCTDSK